MKCQLISAVILLTSLKLAIGFDIQERPEPKNVTANLITSRTILWTWDVPENTGPPLVGYFCSCYDSRSKDVWTTDASKRTFLCEDLKPYTIYTFFVATYAFEPGTRKNYTSKPAFKTARTHAEAPTAPVNMTLSLTTEKLIIKWNSPKVWNGPLNGFIVQVQNEAGDSIFEQSRTGYHNFFEIDLFNIPSLASIITVSVKFYKLDSTLGIQMIGDSSSSTINIQN